MFLNSVLGIFVLINNQKQNNMNKETIEQIKQTQGVKMVTSVSEPDVRHKDLIKNEYEKGTLLEYKDKGLSEWKLFSSGVFDWQNYDYRIADPSEHWLCSVADINKSLANRIMEWFDGSVTYDEF